MTGRFCGTQGTQQGHDVMDKHAYVGGRCAGTHAGRSLHIGPQLGEE